jgi:hypothetical protein
MKFIAMLLIIYQNKQLVTNNADSLLFLELWFAFPTSPR